MVNRYTVFQPQQYVETYVPLPLEFINQQGAMKQADLDKHKKELSLDTDPLSKIGSLNAVLKTYDGKGNIVDTEYNKLEDIRRQSLYELSAEREQLASDLASGKISDSEFKAKAASHTKKAADIYNRLSGYKTEVDKINKYNEEFSKNKAYAQDPYYAQKALAYNTEFMKKGELANFAGVDIADTFDFQDAVKNFTFKDEGNQTVSLGDYIFKSGDKGVSKDRVQYAASQIFNNPTSKINQYVNMNVDHQLALYGLSGNEKEYPDGTKITIDKVYKDKDGKLVSEKIPVSYRQKLMADQAESFIQGAITEHAGIVHSEDARANPFAIQKRGFDREDELAAPLASTGPGEEVVGIENIKNNPRFAKYINDDNSIAWDKLFDDSRGNPSGFLENVAIGMHNTIGAIGTLLGFGWGKDAPGYKEANDIKKGVIKDATDFENIIGTEMRNIAKTTGYNKPVTVSNYDDLLKYAENYSKFRGLSLEYHDNEQKVYTNRLNEQKQSYTYFDAATGEAVEDMDVILDPKNKLRALSRTSRPVEGKGAESVLKVQDSQGKIYYARERDNEATKFFDEVFNVNNAGLEYNRTGKLQNSTNVDANKVKSATFEALNELGMDIGYDVAAISYNPSDKNELYVTIANPRNKSEQMMVRMDAKTYTAKTTKIGGEERALVAPNEFMSKQNQNWSLSHWGGALRKASKTYKTSEVEENENEEID